MPLTTRPIAFDLDRDELLAVLQRNLPDLPHTKRFAWLYGQNPAGPPHGWFLCDSTSGQVFGAASLFPRLVWVGTELSRCGQVGDFAVDATHRSLGPALMLQRATFRPVDSGQLAWCYDCPPDARGMTTFHRLGMNGSCRFHRYLRPLKVNRRLSAHVRQDLLQVPLAAFGNRLLRLWKLGARSAWSTTIEVHDGPFDDEFSRLDERLRAPGVIRGRRHCADLNWRYLNHPLLRYRVFTARRQRELLAFAVVCLGQHDAYIADCFGMPVQEVVVPLLDAVCDELRSTEIQDVHAVVADEHPLAPHLSRARFVRRPFRAQVVVYPPAGPSPFGPTTSSGPRWHFTQAELDA